MRALCGGDETETAGTEQESCIGAAESGRPLIDRFLASVPIRLEIGIIVVVEEGGKVGTEQAEIDELMEGARKDVKNSNFFFFYEEGR